MRALFDRWIAYLLETNAVSETAGLITCPDDPLQIIPKLLDLGMSEATVHRSLNKVFGWVIYSVDAYGEFEYSDPARQWGYAGGILFLSCPFDTSMQPVALLPEGACKECKGIGLLPPADRNVDVYDRAIAERVIRGWLKRAAQQNASDLHIMPLTSNYVRVRMRLDGQLRTLDEVAMSDGEMSYRYISNMLLRMMGCQTGDFTKPIDGRFECAVGDCNLEVRVAMRPVSVQSKACQAFFLRLLKQGGSATFRTLESLGLPEWATDFFTGIRRLSQGLVLMTGPTGSGKSSTLYANLARIARDDPWRSIQTLEDPIEQSIEGIMQTQINADIGMGFHEGLRALMRSDVDVILVGEVRDEKTAKLVVRASLTGHLVFATLHAQSALSAIERMLDLGVSGQALSSVLSALVSQRLLRRVCRHCVDFIRFAEHPGYRRYEGLLHADDRVPVANHAGCAHCNGGYRGRVPVIEAIRTGSALSGISGNESAGEKLAHYAQARQYPTLWSEAASLIRQGRTTPEECERYLPSRDEDGFHIGDADHALHQVAFSFHHKQRSNQNESEKNESTNT